MKKLVSILLLLVMLCGICAVSAEDAPVYLYTGPDYDYDYLTVGNTTKMSGNFTTSVWGSNTADLDVRALVNGYNLIRWDYGNGNFNIDGSVITGLNVIDDAEGNRTFQFTIGEDLVWSDGTPITAYDYAFGILMQVAPQLRELGGDTDNYACLLGMKEWKNGEADKLAGVSVLNDQILALTIAKEYRPFFYELGQLMCYPMPISVIAPGCAVRSDDAGIWVEGEMTADLLRETMLNPEKGYLSHPSVVSGPYRLVSYDAENGTAEFEANEYFKGNVNDAKPQIRYLTYTLADNATMMDKLANGEFGLLNKCMREDAVTAGIQLVGGENYAMQSYPRVGQSFFSFCCEKTVVSGQKVRQAIAYCLDKDQLVYDYSGNYGLRVDGYYGIGQWMYEAVNGAIAAPVQELKEDASAEETAAYEAELEEWAELNMDDIRVYNLDIEAAVKLLEEDGWTLNRNGEAFTAGEDDVRCKEIGGEIVALDLKMIYPEGNNIAGSLNDTFINHLAEAGIKVTAEPVAFTELLDMYYRRTARDCDIIYLASNFEIVFDPWPTFDPADADTGLTNYSAVRDDELCALAKDMSMTEPGDNLTYVKKWLAFQARYEEVMPSIPVYSNVYFDFFTRCLQQYQIVENATWSQAIIESQMGDPEAPEAEAEEDGEEIIFE